MRKFILVVNGPICAGKSTAVDLLLSRHKNLFHVSYDKIKWLISDYSPIKHYPVVNKLVYSLAVAALKNGFSLVVNGALLKETRARYRRLSAKASVKFLEINIVAPESILKDRFKKRVASARKAKSKISAVSISDMESIYNRYQFNKNKKAATFDSSRLHQSQIVFEIEKLLALNS